MDTIKQHTHIDDSGKLSLFVKDDGTFAIVCDQGHGWYGKWTGVLTAFKPETKQGIRALGGPSAPEWVHELFNPT